MTSQANPKNYNLGSCITALGRSNANIFDTSHLKADIKGRSFRGGVLTVSAQGIKFILQTGSTAVLARLLTPADFGLIAMVTAFTGFVNLFKDLGLSMATIQKKDITHQQITNLFWVNIATSCLLMIVYAMISPFVSWFYGEPKLILVTIAMGPIFIFGGLVAQHTALMRRQMRFRALAVIEVVAMASGIIAAIIAALSGRTYWSLVIMTAVKGVVNVILVWWQSPWRPGRPARHFGAEGLLSFGINLTGFNIINYFARNIDNILIGKIWGSVSLGFYSKAYGLLMLPITQVATPIAAVAIPALSRLQNDKEEYKNYYYRAINLIAWITMPIVLMLAALSEEIIRIVLGEQWMAAVPIFKVLAFASVIQPVVNPVGWVYISLGQVDRLFRWSLFAVPVTCMSFAIGLPWGPIGVAVSYTICSLTITFPCLSWAFRYSPITIRGWLAMVRCPLITSFVIYGVVEFTHTYIHFNPVKMILGGGSVGLGMLILVVGLWREARYEALDGLQLLKLLQSSSTT